MRPTLALLLTLLAGPAFAQDFAAYDTWYPGFSACDWHLAGRAWGLDATAASLKIQTLVQEGESAEVQAAIDAVKPTITPTGWEVCDYHEPGLTYDDAEQLASYWGLGDPSEAKARIEAKLIARDTATLTTALGEARAAWEQAHAYDPGRDQSRQAFFDAGFDWCDAEAVAAVWGVDFDDAKVRIGDLLQAGDKKIAKTVKKARKKYGSCGE